MVLFIVKENKNTVFNQRSTNRNVNNKYTKITDTLHIEKYRQNCLVLNCQEQGLMQVVRLRHDVIQMVFILKKICPTDQGRCKSKRGSGVIRWQLM